MATQSLTITTRAGRKLAALFDQPEGKGPHPLVVLLHGFTGWKTEEHLTTLAEELATHGIAALRFDAPGSGDSEGTWAEDYRLSHYLAAVADVVAYATESLSIDTERLGIWGHSMGGLTAIIAASTMTQFKALCGSQASTGNTHVTPEELADWRQSGWRRIKTRQFGEFDLPIAFYDDRDQYDALAAVPQVLMPSLFIAGTRDESVSAESVHSLYLAAAEPKQYVEFPTTHHYKKDPLICDRINAVTVEFFLCYLTSSDG